MDVPADDGRVLLEAQGLRRAFGARTVPDGVDLRLHRGESLVLLGPSGGGKTMLLKHLIGLRRPGAGIVFVAGQDFRAAPRREQHRLRRRLSLAFQDGALFDSMDVFDNVAFPLRRARYGDERKVKGRVEECLELMHLSLPARRLPAELSTGMRRRVGFARAIALQPDILLFDEPTAGSEAVGESFGLQSEHRAEDGSVVRNFQAPLAFSAQLGARLLPPLAVRAGLTESWLGAGVDAFAWDDRLRLSVDAWDFGRGQL